MKDGKSFIEGNNSKNILNSSIYIYMYILWVFHSKGILFDQSFCFPMPSILHHKSLMPFGQLKLNSPIFLFPNTK